MNIFCPNFSNKQVKREFNQLKESVGENRAYYLWSKNNGYSLDRTSDGSPSTLWQSCLNYSNGDINKAIDIKSAIYSLNLPDSEESFDSIVKDYNKYASSAENKQKIADMPIHVENVFDTVASKLGLGTNASIDAVNGTSIDSFKDFVNKFNPNSNDAELFDKLSQYDCPVIIEPMLDDNTPLWFDGKTLHMTDSFLHMTNKDLATKMLLHEYMHVAVSHILDNPTTELEKSIVERLNGVYSIAKSIKKDGIIPYGFSNIQEFVSEFMSNPTFRNQLRAKNIFKRIVNCIKSIFTGKKYMLDSKEYKEVEDNINGLINIGYRNTGYTNGSLLSAPVFYKTEEKSTSENVTTFDKKAESLKNVLIDGLRKRMKSLSVRGSITGSEKTSISNDIEKLNRLENTQAVYNFLYNNMAVVSAKTDEYANRLEQQIRDKGSLTKEEIRDYAAKLNNLNADFIGFYRTMTDDFSNFINRFGKEFSEKTGGDIRDFQEIIAQSVAHINRVDSIFHRLSSEVAKQAINEAYAGITETDENGKERTIQDVIDAINWVDSEINSSPEEVLANKQRDVWSLNSFAGQYSSSNNSLVRIVADMLSNAMNKVERLGYDKGTSIKQLYLAAEKSFGKNCQTILQEKDDEGNTTGYFTRNLKYGLLRRDVRNFKEDLSKKYNLSLDKDGVPILPKKGDKNFDKYWEEYDNWMDKHANRRYTKEYYKLTRQLSEDTKEKLKDINNDISKLLSKTRTLESELPDLMKLTEIEFRNLQKLKIEKKLLSYEYYTDGSKKEGRDLEIALELQELNKKKQEGLSSKFNKELLEQERKKVLKKYGVKSKEYNTWLLRNTQEAAPDWFSEQFSNESNAFIEELSKNKEYQELKKQYKSILEPYKLTYYMGYDPDSMSDALIEKLKKIDIRMKEIVHDLSEKFKDENNDTEHTSPITQNVMYNQHMIDIEKSGNYTSDSWYIRNHISFNGHSYPLRAWNIFAPTDRSYRVQTGTSQYYATDVNNSVYANKDFVDNGEEVQPKRTERYINKDFDKIKNNKELFTLYNALIKTMEEGNKKGSFQERPDSYKLPQMSGRMSSLLKRSHGHVLNALKFQTNDLVKTHDDDLDYIEKQDTRPDGSKIRNVPFRFVQLLNDPSKITSDVIGSVVQFYEMACNYDIKTHEFAPVLETLAEQAYNKTKILNNKGKVETVTQGQTNVYKAIRKMLDMHMYGEKRSKITLNMFGREINLSKILDQVYEYTSMIHLTGNLNTSLVGYTTAKGAAITNAFLGKYYNKRDYMWAEKEFGKNLGSVLKGLGSIDYNDKLICCMDFNNTTRQNNDIFAKSDQSRVLRFITTHFAYGSYTLGDTAVKGVTTLSMYHSIRLCNVNGKKIFMSREDFVNKFYSKDKKKGIRNFDKQGTCLWDAYEVVDGKFQAKKQFAQYISSEMESRLKNRLEAINVRNDGNISDLDRSGMFSNSILHYAVQHRNFLMLFQERFKKKQYNFKTGTIEEGYYRACKDGIFKIVNKKDIYSLNRMIKNYNNLSDIEKYGTKKVLYDLSFIILTTILIHAMILPFANDPDNKDDWYVQEMSYLLEKTNFEFGTYYRPDDVLGLLKSPTASSSDINNLFSIFEAIAPWNWINENPLKESTKGVYKGMPWIGKQAIKLTPAKNLVESFSSSSIKAKRKFQENQIQNGF